MSEKVENRDDLLDLFLKFFEFLFSSIATRSRQFSEFFCLGLLLSVELPELLFTCWHAVTSLRYRLYLFIFILF